MAHSNRPISFLVVRVVVSMMFILFASCSHPTGEDSEAGIKKFKVKLIQPDKGGTIISTPNIPEEGKDVDAGTVITFTADTDEGYMLAAWDGASGTSDFSSTAKLIVQENTVVTAEIKPFCNVTLKQPNAAYGEIISNPKIPEDGRIPIGTDISFRAYTQYGYDVIRWSGASPEDNNIKDATIKVSGDITVEVLIGREKTLHAGKSSPASNVITLSKKIKDNNSAKLHFYYGGESQTNYKRNLIRFIFLDQNQEEIRSESFLYDSPSTWGGLKFVEKEMIVDFSPEEIAKVKYLQLYVEAGDYQSAMRYYKEELEAPFISREKSNSPTLAPITVEGNRIHFGGVEESVAGNSLFWSNNGWGGEKYYNGEVLKWLKANWNTKIIRASMGIEKIGGYLDDKNGNKAKVINVVNSAIKNGLYVIIDWHSHEAQEHEAEAIAFFKEMSGKYGQYHNVIYEIYNEPLNTTSWIDDIKPYAEKVIAEIRKNDPDNLIVVGTPTWSQDVDIASLNPISNFSNIAYTLHFYAGTHGQSIRDKAQTALNNGIALFVTEWSPVNADATGKIADIETTAWMEFLRENNISHVNWAINDKEESASVLKPGASTFGGWSDSDLTASGLFVKNIIQNW